MTVNIVSVVPFIGVLFVITPPLTRAETPNGLQVMLNPASNGGVRATLKGNGPLTGLGPEVRYNNFGNYVVGEVEQAFALSTPIRFSGGTTVTDLYLDNDENRSDDFGFNLSDEDIDGPFSAQGSSRLSGASFSSLRPGRYEGGINDGGLDVGLITLSIGESLFLDFGTRIDKEFYLAETLFGAQKYYTYRDGTSNAASFTPTQVAAIVRGVQDVFDNSGIAINVTDVAPDAPSLTVRFAPPLAPYDRNGDGTLDSILRGWAYDVAPDNLSAKLVGNDIDRFDKRKDGTVAVFLDGTAEMQKVVEIVAHEVGHGYGARHINPGGQEVMDYTSSESPTFSSEKNDIVSFNSNGPEVTSETHNPVYHLRRYMVRENNKDLLDEGLMPGSWDDSAFSLFGFKFELFDFSSQSISDLNVLFDDEVGGGFSGETEDGGAASPLLLASSLSNGATFDFLLRDKSTFRIVGSSSEGSNLFDIVFGYDAPTGMDTLLSWDKVRLQLPLSVVKIDKTTKQWEVIGSAFATTFEGGSVQASVIPIPGTLWFLLAPLIACITRRQ